MSRCSVLGLWGLGQVWSIAPKCGANRAFIYPRAPTYLHSRLLGYVTIGYVEPRTHYLGNWSPRVPAIVLRGAHCRVGA